MRPASASIQDPRARFPALHCGRVSCPHLGHHRAGRDRGRRSPDHGGPVAQARAAACAGGAEHGSAGSNDPMAAVCPGSGVLGEDPARRRVFLRRDPRRPRRRGVRPARLLLIGARPVPHCQGRATDRLGRADRRSVSGESGRVGCGVPVARGRRGSENAISPRTSPPCHKVAEPSLV